MTDIFPIYLTGAIKPKLALNSCELADWREVGEKKSTVEQEKPACYGLMTLELKVPVGSGPHSAPQADSKHGIQLKWEFYQYAYKSNI